MHRAIRSTHVNFKRRPTEVEEVRNIAVCGYVYLVGEGGAEEAEEGRGEVGEGRSSDTHRKGEDLPDEDCGGGQLLRGNYGRVL